MSDTRGPEYEDGEETVAPPGAAPEPVPGDTTDFFVEAEAEAVVTEEARPRARLLPMWILLAAVVLVGVAWAVSDRYFDESGGVESVPLITAEETPVKVRPADPGGVEVLDRDKYVYKSLTDDEPDAESLLPPPEEPMQRPSVEVSEAEALVDPAEPAEESMAEVIEAAPEPARPEEPDVAAVAPQEMQHQETEQEMEEAAEPVVKNLPAELPEPATPEAEELLDAVTPEPKIVEAEPVPAPEPEPEPESAPEPEPAPESEAKAAPAAAETVTETTAETTAATVDGPGFMVQVGSTQNEAAAGEELERLAKKHAALLGALDTVVVRADLGDKGVWYRMRVGPFAARDEANDVCGQLKAVDVGCYVVAN